MIKDAEVLGTFETRNDAVTVGYQTFGHVPFLTKQILPHELPLALVRI